MGELAAETELTAGAAAGARLRLFRGEGEPPSDRDGGCKGGDGEGGILSVQPNAGGSVETDAVVGANPTNGVRPSPKLLCMRFVAVTARKAEDGLPRPLSSIARLAPLRADMGLEAGVESSPITAFSRSGGELAFGELPN